MLLKILHRANNAIDDCTSKLKACIKGNGINAFWWRGTRNFGDSLTPELLGYYGYQALHNQPEKATISGVGSLIQILPKNFNGIILGSGCIDNKLYNLPNAQFKLVRGDLSINSLGIAKDTSIGDPGLLADRLLATPVKKKFEIGLVPHFVDKAHPWIKKMIQSGGNRVLLINVQDSAANVAQQISQCEMIFSSSLHGLIVADSFHIPNVWLELSKNVIGNGFKFHDYNTAINFEQDCEKISESTSLHQLTNRVCFKNAAIIDSKKTEIQKVIMDTLSHL